MYQFARVETGRQEGLGNGIQGEGFGDKGFRDSDFGIYTCLCAINKKAVWTRVGVGAAVTPFQE